jgi:hypothetical protein
MTEIQNPKPTYSHAQNPKFETAELVEGKTHL